MTIGKSALFPLTSSNHEKTLKSQTKVSSSSTTAYLPPPSFYWGKLWYFDQWQNREKHALDLQNAADEYDINNIGNSNEIVFGLSYLINYDSNLNVDDGISGIRYPGTWLAGCTKSGDICVWDTTTPSTKTVEEEEGVLYNDKESNSLSLFRKEQQYLNGNPIWSQQVSKGTLYACKFVTTSDNSNWFVVSGDDGVFIFDWDDLILPAVHANYSNEQAKMFSHTASTDTKEEEEPPKKKNTQLQHPNRSQNSRSAFGKDTEWNEIPIIQPIQKYETFPSPIEVKKIEINDFVMEDRYLYGVAGDSFCYKWDLETDQLVATYRQPRKQNKTNIKTSQHQQAGYLQTIERVPGTNLLLMGGEDGMLNIWDSSQDQIVGSFDMSTELPSPSSSPSNSTNINRKWISSCISRDETWWTVAGGCTTSTRHYDNGGGFLATFHGPTRSLVSSIYTRETPQQLTYYTSPCTEKLNCQATSSHESSSNSSILLQVSNESFVSHWNDPLQFMSSSAPPQEQRKKIWSTTPSGYSIASNQNGQIAVGGVGSVVDVYENRTQPSLKLKTRREN